MYFRMTRCQFDLLKLLVTYFSMRTIKSHDHDMADSGNETINSTALRCLCNSFKRGSSQSASSHSLVTMQFVIMK